MSKRCSIAIVNRSTRPLDLHLAQVQQVVDAALEEAGVDACQLSVLVVDEAESATLHRRHFSDDSPTDVMTFPDGSRDPETGLRLLGDLAICVGIAERIARERQRRVDDELCLYILHGVLHILGYDDQDEAEAQRLWSTQQRLMATIGVDIGSEPS
jgi:probable rRNA maturation factor